MIHSGNMDLETVYGDHFTDIPSKRPLIIWNIWCVWCFIVNQIWVCSVFIFISHSWYCCGIGVLEIQWIVPDPHVGDAKGVPCECMSSMLNRTFTVLFVSFLCGQCLLLSDFRTSWVSKVLDKSEFIATSGKDDLTERLYVYRLHSLDSLHPHSEPCFWLVHPTEWAPPLICQSNQCMVCDRPESDTTDWCRQQWERLWINFKTKTLRPEFNRYWTEQTTVVTVGFCRQVWMDEFRTLQLHRPLSDVCSQWLYVDEVIKVFA